MNSRTLKNNSLPFTGVEENKHAHNNLNSSNLIKETPQTCEWEIGK